MLTRETSKKGRNKRLCLMGFIVEQWETPPVSLTLNHLLTVE